MPMILARPLCAFALAALMAEAGLAQTAGAPAVTAPSTVQAEPGPGDAGAYLAARVAAAESDYRAAGAWYSRALAGDETNPGLLDGALISAMALGSFDVAVPLAQRLLDLGAQSQPAALALLTDKAQRGEFDAILADAAAGASVNELVDGLVLAWSQLGAGKMSEALEGFDTLAATEGLEAFGLYHKALALASVGDFEGADAILSGEAGGRLRMMRRGTVAHVQILSQLERGDEAVALLDSTFGTGQDAGIDALRARLVAGETLAYDVTRNATDGMAEVFFTLATAISGEADDAYTLLYTRAATHLRPDHAEALLMSASLLGLQKQYQLASETFARIPTDDPMFFVAEIGRADALYADGKTEAALEVLQNLTRSHGDLMQVHLALGDALRRAERFAEAVPAYDAAIARIPEPQGQHWPLFYSRGMSQERLGNWPEAEADMRRALELDPDQPQVLNYLGYSFVDRGENLDEALKMIERAVAARPDSGYIIDSLAWAYFRLGRYADAVEPMEKASLLEPVDPVVTDHLGDVYWAVGRRLEAQFQWRRALSFDPAEKDATRIRRKLEAGLDAVLQAEGAEPISLTVTEGKNGN